MKTAASYIKNKYDCYKGYSEESIREVCHIWCEVIEEAQNDVKKEYEEKLRWIPIEEKLPENRERVLVKVLRSDKSTIMSVVKIELYHEYSEVDKCHNFGLVTENLQGSIFVKNYIQWIWFWVAIKLKNKDVKLFPYSLGKLVYSYKFCNDGERQGEIIARRIDSFF